MTPVTTLPPTKSTCLPETESLRFRPKPTCYLETIYSPIVGETTQPQKVPALYLIQVVMTNHGPSIKVVVDEVVVRFVPLDLGFV
jgi:hypothetical protein